MKKVLLFIFLISGIAISVNADNGGDASDIQHRRTTGCDNGKCPQGKRCVRGWCVS